MKSLISVWYKEPLKGNYAYQRGFQPPTCPMFHFVPRHKYGYGSGKHELIKFLTSTPEGTDFMGRFSNTKPKSIQQ